MSVKKEHSDVLPKENVIAALQEDESDDSWDEDYDEKETVDQQVFCIFSGQLFPCAKDYFIYLKEHYNFDIWSLVHIDLELDFFGYVKLINYLRSNFTNHNPPTLKELLSSKTIWNNEKYLKPVVQDDPLLQFIIDDDDDNEEEEEYDFNTVMHKYEVDETSNSNDKGEVSLELMKKQLAQFKSKNQHLESQLTEMNAKMTEMKKFMQDVILKGEIYRPVSACRQNHDVQEEDFEDSGYFGTYSHHDIHAEMLQDKIRTLSYQNAILSNSDVFRDKIVLDVGCGTGILSMFAARAGAKHVYGIDMSDIAYQAIDIIKENKLEEKVTIIKACIEEVDLPVSKVDIIISEWMGYFLLYESMLDSVLFASEKWLHSDGMVLPNGCTVYLVAAHDENLFKSQVQYWDDVYGFQMSCIKTATLQEASIQVLQPGSVLSEPVSIMNFSIPGISMQKLNYSSEFSIKMNKSGKCSAIVGYFDIHFRHGLYNPVSFSTGPLSTPTHWKQTVFFLRNAIDVNEGEVYKGFIDCHKNPCDPRSLVVIIRFAGNRQTYTLS